MIIPLELLFAISAAILGAAVATLVVMLSLWRINARNHRQNAVALSATREFYERQMSDLVRRLTATQERWEDVNHLVLAGQKAQSDVLQVFDPSEIPIFGDLGIVNEDLAIEPDLVFVLTPVLREEEPTYNAIYRAAASVGLRATRSDFEIAPGDILKQIVILITRARIVVANVSSRNPNVYYELGIAHALGKQCIIVSRTVDEVTFDISSQRVLTFNSPATLDQKLRVAFVTALKGGHQTLGRSG